MGRLSAAAAGRAFEEVAVDERESLARSLVAAACAGLYFMACLTPALQFGEPQTEPLNGLVCLLLGWLSLVQVPAWLANPALLWGLVLFARRRYRAAVVALALATGLALSILVALRLPMDVGDTGAARLRYPLAGFYLWLAAILVPLVTGVGLLRAGVAPTPAPGGASGGDRVPDSQSDGP